MSPRTTLVTMILVAGLVPAPSVAEPTVKDLDAAKVRPGEQVQPDPDRARQLYRDLLEMGADDPQLQTEALRRLGDMEMELGDAQRGELPGPGAGTAETRAAIELYTRLLEEHPDYRRSDVVLYQLGRAWEAEGEPERALAHLDQLVTRFPESVHYIEAQFRRGEILFSAQRWRDSEAAYAAVISAGSSTAFFDQALYKHGWTLFKQSATEQSAQSFMVLLDRQLLEPGAPGSVVPFESLSRADRELVDDTFRAMSIQFAGLDGSKSLDQAVDAHGGPAYAWMLYDSLGGLLVEKERYTDAADAYHGFVQRDPTHARAPELQDRAVDAYLKGGFADLAFEAKQEFVRLYAFDSPFWEARDRSSAPQVVAQLKSHLQDVARYQHATAQATGAPADYAAAVASYRQYLASFPDDPELAQSNFMLADLLFESGAYGDATVEYERTAYDYPRHARSAEAGYAALVAYDKEEAQLAGEQKAGWHLASIESALRFAQTFPQHPEAGRVRLRAAQQLFNLGDYDRASAIARQATTNDLPLQPDEMRTAWNIVADSAFETGSFAEAEPAYRQVLLRTADDAQNRPDMTERLAATIYKQGEAKQAAGDPEGAVADFLRIGALAPASPIRATAEYDAAALLIREKQWVRAIPVLEAFRRDHPDHPLAASVPQSLALAYSEAGRPLQAAKEFEGIAENGSESAEVRRAALVEAATLYEQGGDEAAAAAAWERFVDRYPDPLDEANAVRLKLADMARGAGDPAGRKRWLQSLIEADAGAGMARTDASKLLAARAALELAAPSKAEFESIQLSAPLSRTLKAKRAALEQALKAYQQAADYGVAEVTTAATFATAELYRRLAGDLMASERPRNLDADELEQYDLLLEEQAYPFEERAIELHESNVARAREGLYDDSVRASYTALASLSPGRYARQETLDLVRPAQVDADPAGPGILPVVSTPLVAAGSAAAAAGEWALAEQQYSAALESGGGAPAMTGLGVAYRNTGRFSLAEGAYRSALQADPDYAPAMLNLAVLLDLYLQRPAEALEQYEAYQAKLSAPDERVAGWIRELEIRTGRGAAGSGVEP
jgi:tetratricopeptide (TPR) repeat protein